jgi:hypothetical protein
MNYGDFIMRRSENLIEIYNYDQSVNLGALMAEKLYKFLDIVENDQNDH